MLALAPYVKAQDSTLSFSLTEAQNYAIENFFLSKNAELDIDAAKKKIWETTAIGLPQVKATGDFQYYLDDELPMLGFPNFDETGNFLGIEEANMFERQNMTYGGNVSQLIFSGEYIVGLQAAKVYKLLSEENFEKVKIDVKETIAGTYFTILILNENERVIKETLENLRLNLEHSQKTYAVGLIEDTDVDQLELTVKRTENDLKSIENQLETMQRMLKYQLGVEPNVTVDLKDELVSLLEENIIDESAYQFVLDENIEYKMLTTQENLQQLNMNREKSLLLPTVAGFYNYSDQANATLFTPPKHLVGVTASWSIFESGKRNAKISQARIELEKAQNMKEQEAQRLILSAQQATFDYQTALTQYYNEETNFELSKKVFDKTTQRYGEGFVSSLDLSIVNNQYLGAQLSYALAIQNLLTTKIALDKAYNKL